MVDPGRVEAGETLAAAAVREVFEETGVPVRLDGILRLEHSPTDRGVRVRMMFAGSPIDDTEPKASADDESLGAAWLTLEEVRSRRLRGAELCALLESVENGRQVFPLDLLGPEMSV